MPTRLFFSFTFQMEAPVFVKYNEKTLVFVKNTDILFKLIILNSNFLDWLNFGFKKEFHRIKRLFLWCSCQNLYKKPYVKNVKKDLMKYTLVQLEFNFSVVFTYSQVTYTVKTEVSFRYSLRHRNSASASVVSTLKSVCLSVKTTLLSVKTTFRLFYRVETTLQFLLCM
jgi:hypothetical protein